MRRRPAGSGTIYRPTPKHKTLWMAYRSGGKTIRESTGKRTRGEAEAVLRQRVAARDRGGLPAPGIITIADLRRLHLADMRANGRASVDRVERAFVHLEDGLGENTPARDIDVPRVTAYVAARQAEGAENATVNRELAALRRGFRLAVKAGHLDRRPDFSLLTEDNAAQGFLERPDLDKILSHLPAGFPAAVLTAAITGWRIKSEVLTREWRSVDLQARWMRLEPREGKSRKPRMFPLAGELLRVLEAQRRYTDACERRLRRPIPWVFHTEGEPITPNRLRTAWEQACEAAGVWRVLHDLRRTAARGMIRAGIPQRVAQDMGGWKTDSIFKRYGVVEESLLRQAGDKLASVNHSVNKRKPGRARQGTPHPSKRPGNSGKSRERKTG